MKVLVIAGLYYPAKNAGGPVVSIDAICTLLQDQVEFFVLALDQDIGSKERLKNIESGWNKRSNCSVMYLSKKNVNKKSIVSLIKEVNPDFLYLNSLFDHNFVVPVLKCSRSMGLPVLLAPRGQLCKNAFRKKIKKMAYLLFYRRLFSSSNVLYQSTSDEEFKAIVKHLPVNISRVITLSNIPNIKITPPLKIPKVKGSLKVIFISRIHSKKNLIGAIKIFHHVEGHVEFNIFGPIEDQRYWSLCLKEISKLPPNISVNYQGAVDYDAVFSVFSSHDVFLFPTYSENYGHVIAESLLSACPVLISDQTPWSDVGAAGVGWAYPLDDHKSFARTLDDLVALGAKEYREISSLCSSFVLDRLNLDELHKQYYSGFKKIAGIQCTAPKS
jgi:glycosyltransferase involved in cell wall biosynthesis